MFGLFRKKMAPEGPVEFDLDMEIGCPAAELYRLLDWADENNAKRREGQQVTPGDGSGQWRLVMTGMEDVTYHITVTDKEPGRAYGYHCTAEPTVGRLATAHELYHIESLAPDRCRITSRVTAIFVSGMTEKQFAQEVTMMSMACHNSLARLKIHAEYGAAAARDAEMVSAQRIRVEA